MLHPLVTVTASYDLCSTVRQPSAKHGARAFTQLLLVALTPVRHFVSPVQCLWPHLSSNNVQLPMCCMSYSYGLMHTRRIFRDVVMLLQDWS